MPTKKKSQKYLRAAKKAPVAPPARKDSHVVSLRLDDEEHAKLVRFQDALSRSSKLDVKLATAVKHAALQHAAGIVSNAGTLIPALVLRQDVDPDQSEPEVDMVDEAHPEELP